MKQCVLVFDCGATNVRAIAVDARGALVHSETRPNAPVRQRGDRPWLVWDTEAIWKSLLECGNLVVRRTGSERIVAVVATSFSDDGAPVDRSGRLLYPVISWQCPRTVEIADSIDTVIPFRLLYRITGEQVMRQHTLFRLLWLRKHAPRALQEAHKYLMFPGILNFRLTGEMVNDPTTADSMMLLDIRRRAYSGPLLKRAGFPEAFFGRMVEPGRVIGEIAHPAARKLGLRPRTPVVAAGHDTQFAVCGSGCRPGEAVLSSGTWEILFLRTPECSTGTSSRNAGIKNECDAVPGLFNVGQQWIGSGALEWLLGLTRGDGRKRREPYGRMMEEAGRIPAGSNGVMVQPSFLPGSGISRRYNTAGTILGCTLGTTPAEIYRAFLEGLSFELREAVENLRKHARFRANSLTVVGGGSRNGLWNRIRADVLNVPIRLTRQAENTVVGAAIFGFMGAGIYGNYDEAAGSMLFEKEFLEPSTRRDIYDGLYSKYRSLGPSLAWLYRAGGRGPG